jgi:hypothetical protein
MPTPPKHSTTHTNSNFLWGFGSKERVGGVYEYSFNGFEKDDEVKGEGNHISFGDYGYDSRLGRRWKVDPKFKEFPFFSTYVAFGNNPIFYIDNDGKRIYPSGAAAIAAFDALMSSFGSEKQQFAMFHFVESDIKKGVYSSRDLHCNGCKTQFKVAENFKEFKGRYKNFVKDARKKGESYTKLKKRDLKLAYAVYLAIVDQNEIQIEVIEAGSMQVDVRGQGSGTPGSVVSGYDSRLNVNQGLENLKKDIEDNGIATIPMINEAVPQNKEMFINSKYKPDYYGKGYAFYGSAPGNDAQNNGIKGTILIDGTGKTPNQNAQTIVKALNDLGYE